MVIITVFINCLICKKFCKGVCGPGTFGPGSPGFLDVLALLHKLCGGDTGEVIMSLIKTRNMNDVAAFP